MSPAIAFSLVYLLAATIALAAVAVIWPRRAAPGGEGKLFISQLKYIGVIAAAPCFFHAAMALSGRTGRMPGRLITAVWAVPVASLMVAWTNPWHQWLWTEICPECEQKLYPMLAE